MDMNPSAEAKLVATLWCINICSQVNLVVHN